mmetsp:Transcript_34170/g.69860  ORF Transcript_34170/g.69860 Transcript_34170/m.69860 type:complete len:230 (-) Transcript_34170:1351-2040(-)
MARVNRDAVVSERVEVVERGPREHAQRDLALLVARGGVVAFPRQECVCVERPCQVRIKHRRRLLSLCDTFTATTAFAAAIAVCWPLCLFLHFLVLRASELLHFGPKVLRQSFVRRQNRVFHRGVGLALPAHTLLPQLLLRVRRLVLLNRIAADAVCRPDRGGGHLSQLKPRTRNRRVFLHPPRLTCRLALLSHRRRRRLAAVVLLLFLLLLKTRRMEQKVGESQVFARP